MTGGGLDVVVRGSGQSDELLLTLRQGPEQAGGCGVEHLAEPVLAALAFEFAILLDPVAS